MNSKKDCFYDLMSFLGGLFLLIFLSLKSFGTTTSGDDNDTEEFFKSLSEYLHSAISDNMDDEPDDTTDTFNNLIWSYNLPFDFKIQNQSLLFSFVDIKSNQQIKNQISENGNLEFRNYYFWLFEKYLFVLHDKSVVELDTQTDSVLHCYGLTECNSPFYYDYTILELNDNNEWQVAYYDDCDVAKLWLDARYHNVIDCLIKRELFKSDDIGYDCLIAPNYSDKSHTLYQNSWTLNPSYANNLYYATSNAECSIANTLIFNSKLFDTYFDPIRTHLESNNLSQCYLCEPKFALTGDTLSIRLVFNLCTLKPNGEITKQIIRTIDSTYRYASPYKSSPERKHWIKQK